MNDLADTCAHELGHAIVATRCVSGGVTIQIFASTEGNGKRSVMGGAQFEPPENPEQRAMIGWAGMLAESKHKASDGGPKDLEDFSKAFKFTQFLVESGHLSASDRSEIQRGIPAMTRKTAKRAWDLLEAEWPTLLRLKDYLVETFKRDGKAAVTWTAATGWKWADEPSAGNDPVSKRVSGVSES